MLDNVSSLPTSVYTIEVGDSPPKKFHTDDLQFQTKIVRRLPLSTVFSLLVRFLLLTMLLIAVNSPNLAHQHWEGKKTAKWPNNFD